MTHYRTLFWTCCNPSLQLQDYLSISCIRLCISYINSLLLMFIHMIISSSWECWEAKSCRSTQHNRNYRLQSRFRRKESGWSHFNTSPMPWPEFTRPWGIGSTFRHLQLVFLKTNCKSLSSICNVNCVFTTLYSYDLSISDLTLRGCMSSFYFQ